jgi:DNA-directed RNA polymerase specialized sigma24 family protein
LSIYNGQSYDEIASVLGVSRAHVAILLFRARQQLRKTLAPRGDATGGHT